MRFPRYRYQLVQFRIQGFSAAFDLLPVALLQRGLKAPYVRGDQVVTFRLENIVLVTQILLRVA